MQKFPRTTYGIGWCGLLCVLLAGTGCPEVKPLPDPEPDPRTATWEHIYYDIGIGKDITQLTDGRYVLATGFGLVDGGNLAVLRKDGKLERLIGGAGGQAVCESHAGGAVSSGASMTIGSDDNDMVVSEFEIDAVAPETAVWTSYFGRDWTDIGQDVETTADGGYIVVGDTGEEISAIEVEVDVLLVKLDSTGQEEWSRIIPVSEHDDEGSSTSDRASSVLQAPDGGFVVAGTARAASGDPFILKTDVMGNVVWTTILESDAAAEFDDLCKTRDGGYAATGIRYSYNPLDIDLYVAKFDNAGNLLWDKTFGGPDPEFGESIALAKDGGLILAGTSAVITADASTSASFLLKLDGNGVEEWSQKFEPHVGNDPITIVSTLGKAVCLTNDGGYALMSIGVYASASTGEAQGLYCHVVNTDSTGILAAG